MRRDVNGDWPHSLLETKRDENATYVGVCDRFPYPHSQRPSMCIWTEPPSASSNTRSLSVLLAREITNIHLVPFARWWTLPSRATCTCLSCWFRITRLSSFCFIIVGIKKRKKGNQPLSFYRRSLVEINHSQGRKERKSEDLYLSRLLENRNSSFRSRLFF